MITLDDIFRVEEFVDASIYTQLFTPPQERALQSCKAGVMIGLQDPVLAREMRDQVTRLGLWRAYYVTDRSQDLTIPETGSLCAIDIESGCFTDRGEVLGEVQAELSDGLQVAVYGNEQSMRGVLVSPEDITIAQYPLMWANYGPADPSRFVDFLGFVRPAMMQYAGSSGWMGCNVDLDLLIFYQDHLWVPKPAN